ncbi:hypothetical protein [Psychroserpens luteus]|uniref:Beta-lactamase-inhibitor-like, PepSY-like n=1 Tax=Psychroserpens luteus TaxID=1434066 RepID=A0ABW5ZMJ7_9FLAO|nr:hypothetical protein [Psychroserpens luteus]
MKTLKRITVLVIAAMTLSSCGGGSGKQPATADGFSDIQNQIQSEFGDDAYFTDISIVYNESIGNIVGVTVTQDPSSLKMGQWNQTQGVWQQNQDISIQVPEGSKAEDFMYQLNSKISLSKLGELTEKSTAQLTADKKIENPTLNMAFVKFPKNGDVSKTEYTIMLKPEHGGTTFTFRYNLNGELIEMDY